MNSDFTLYELAPPLDLYQYTKYRLINQQTENIPFSPRGQVN